MEDENKELGILHPNPQAFYDELIKIMETLEIANRAKYMSRLRQIWPS